MSISPRSSVVLVFLVWIAGFSLLPLFNYSVDIARVFHGDEQFYAKPVVREENKRVSRMRYLQEHQDKYRKYIAGSSRVWTGMATRMMGPEWVKMNYPGGSIAEHLHNLNLLKQEGMLPEQLLLSLEEISLYEEGRKNNDYFRRLLPVTLQEKIDFWKFYLFRAPSMNDWNFWEKGKLRKATWLTMDGAFGSNQQPEILLYLSPYHEFFAKKQTQLPWLMPDIEAIYDLCPTISFITPRHYKTLALRDFNDLYTFNYLLAQVGPFWDFRPLSSPVMTDNTAWKETSHFNHKLGSRVISRLAGQKGDVGVVVTKDNVDSTFADMVQGVQRQLPVLLQKDTMMRVHPSLLNAKPLFRLSDKNAFKGVAGLEQNKGAFVFKAEDSPRIILPKVALLKDTPFLVKVVVEVPEPSAIAATIGNGQFYKRRLETLQSMKKLKQGLLKPMAFTYYPAKKQDFFIPVAGKVLEAYKVGQPLMLHFKPVKGEFIIRDVSFWTFKKWTPPRLNKDMVEFCLSEDTIWSAGKHSGNSLWSVVAGSRNIEKLPKANSFKAINSSPELLLGEIGDDHYGEHVLMVEMGVRKNTPVTLYWKKGGQDFAVERSISQTLLCNDKEHRAYFRIPANLAGCEFMLRPGDHSGVCRIDNLSLRAI